jgi:hypothetical protein
LPLKILEPQIQNINQESRFSKKSKKESKLDIEMDDVA